MVKRWSKDGQKVVKHSLENGQTEKCSILVCTKKGHNFRALVKCCKSVKIGT